MFLRKHQDPARHYLLLPIQVAGRELHKRLGTEECVVSRHVRPNDIRESPFASAVLGSSFDFTPARGVPFTWEDPRGVRLEIIPYGYGFSVTVNGGRVTNDAALLTYIQEWMAQRDAVCTVRSIRTGDPETHIIHAPQRGTSDWKLTIPLAHLDANPFGYRRDATSDDALWVADDGGYFTCAMEIPGIVYEFSNVPPAATTDILQYAQQGMDAHTVID